MTLVASASAPRHRPDRVVTPRRPSVVKKGCVLYADSRIDCDDHALIIRRYCDGREGGVRSAAQRQGVPHQAPHALLKTRAFES
ncbi:MAG TPA: hypothetical protein VKV36_00665 [Acidimicrobiales bacterium]|nr:hypothetical protein [Acidimicrobiales bacterium]